MPQRILITGGSGFIGINAVEYFLAKGYEVMNVDIIPPAHPHQLQFFNYLDILDLSALVTCFTNYQPDFLIHLAAKTDLSSDSIEDYKVNIEGTQNIITALKHITSVKKVVFTSSMLVCKTSYYPSNENDFHPDTVYGESKMAMEKLIRASEVIASWIIVRPTSIWGPWFKTPYRDFFDIVSQNHFIDIGSKYCTKTYGYIGNTVYQIHELMLDSSTHSKVYYLGDDPPVFISEWAREISEEMGIQHPRKFPFFLLKIAAKVGDISKTMGFSFPMSSFRLKNMTTDNIIDLSATYYVATKPPYTRKQGIKNTVAWLKDK